MSRNLLIFLIILLIIWLILGTIFFKNRICGITAAPAEKEKTTKIIPPVTSDRLLIKDGNAFTTSAKNHIDFNASSYNYLTPISAGVDASLKKTATYLKANPNRSMLITGLYKGDEKNNSVFPTLGIARANEVKKILAGLGVGASQLLTGDKLLGAGYALKDGVLLDGVNFSFDATTDDLAERLAVIKARLDANPVTIYFKTGEQNVTLTQAQKKDFSDLVFYLDNKAGSSLEVGGHTDNVGDVAMNKRLSRKRAEFVKDYLTSNGLTASRLSAQGYGPDAPVTSNDTSEGKAKNRRVEVRLK